MWNFLKAIVIFIRDVFSDNGSPSFGRCAAGFALACAMKWVHFLVYKHGELPDLLNILILVGGLYGISKLSAVLEAYMAAKAGVPAPTTHTEVTTKPDGSTGISSTTKP